MKEATNCNDGSIAGDRCCVSGCDGIIEEHERDGGCSCHLHPPCDYCVSAAFYCPVCGWDQLEQE